MGQYTIRGGVEGRERLRLLARVMWPTTSHLLERAGVAGGMACLDAGCGGGDVTFELARLVEPNGHAVGVDIDEVKLQLARDEAAQRQLTNIDFRVYDVGTVDHDERYDVVYLRFLLTHLKDPAGVLASLWRTLRPGGVLVVEDVDLSGYFCYPDSPALWRYVELLAGSMRARGSDPNIGPRLPLLLSEVGCEEVQVNVVQPVATDGDVKLVNPITMENIADTVAADGLASAEEIERVIAEMYEYASDPRTVVSLPRIVQAWGARPTD